MPGGGVEANEDPKQAALRETKEETGVEIEVGDLRLIDNIFKVDEDYLLLVFESTKRYDEQGDYKVEEYAFVNPTEVSSLLPEYYGEFWRGYIARDMS